MKKLLMAMAILAVGATAFGATKTADAPVKVRAEIVDDEIIISDINGRPILLDFEKISLSQTTDKNAYVDFKIQSTGTTANFTKLDLTLGGQSTAANPTNVELTNLDSSLKKDNVMTANLKLDKYSVGTVDTTLTNGGTIHTGRINGTLKPAEWKDANNDQTENDPVATGVYEGQTELKVTVTTN